MFINAFKNLFLSFIRLADYLIVGTLHVLAVNSVQSLFNYYTEQLDNTPTLKEIQSINKIQDKNEESDDPLKKDDLRKDTTSLTRKDNAAGPQVNFRLLV